MANWIVFDFIKSYDGIDFGLWKWLLTWVLPIISLTCLWLAQLIGKKIPFLYQAAKFFLVGTFADVVDIKIFQLFFWIFYLFLPVNQMFIKVISFLTATFVKYWGNRHWVFEKIEREGAARDSIKFFIITVAGLGINVVSFHYFTSIIGPQFSLPAHLWIELSIIFSALITALWNFFGYKFLVFKK